VVADAAGDEVSGAADAAVASGAVEALDVGVVVELVDD
jgi:hypothetical protein